MHDFVGLLEDLLLLLQSHSVRLCPLHAGGARRHRPRVNADAAPAAQGAPSLPLHVDTDALASTDRALGPALRVLAEKLGVHTVARCRTH